MKYDVSIRYRGGEVDHSQYLTSEVNATVWALSILHHKSLTLVGKQYVSVNNTGMEAIVYQIETLKSGETERSIIARYVVDDRSEFCQEWR